MLAAAVSRASVKALEEIYRRHAAAAYALARRLLEDPRRAAAVVSEVFLDLWSHPGRFDPEEECLRSYLLARTYGIAAEDVAAHRGRPTPDASAWAALPDDERQAIELACFQVPPTSTWRCSLNSRRKRLRPPSVSG